MELYNIVNLGKKISIENLNHGEYFVFSSFPGELCVRVKNGYLNLFTFEKFDIDEVDGDEVFEDDINLVEIISPMKVKIIY